VDLDLGAGGRMGGTMLNGRKSKMKTPCRDCDMFEEHVIATLEIQDQALNRLEQKLEKPVLNGGFTTLISKVDKIELITEQLHQSQVESNKKIDMIHDGIYHPETGLYNKVRKDSEWIGTTSSTGKWIIGFIVASVIGALGKMLYDFLTSHVHFVQ